MSSAVAVLICIASLTDYLSQYRVLARKFFFIPAAVYAISTLFTIISDFYFSILVLLHFVPWLIYSAALFFALAWVTDVTVAQCAESTGTRPTGTAPSVGEGYCDLLTHILLLLFTFGIWQLIWIYKVTGYTNAAKNEEYRNPTVKLLLCMFVPFYIIYWTYKTAQRIDEIAAEEGVQSDMAALCLILAIFVGILPPVLLQDRINSIAATKGDVTSTSANLITSEPVIQMTATEVANTAEALKTFKNLLDAGIITQEEFDAKKKQLLGL